MVERVENSPSDIEELAHRIARAFRNFGAFIFQVDIDDKNIVMKLINSTGLSHLLEIKPLDPRHTIYIVYPREKPCRRKCIYDEKLTDNKLSYCINKCIQDFIEKLVSQLLERKD